MAKWINSGKTFGSVNRNESKCRLLFQNGVDKYSGLCTVTTSQVKQNTWTCNLTDHILKQIRKDNPSKKSRNLTLQ